MRAELYVIQYFHDLRRHEGRNVGVAVVDQSGKTYLRFLGETRDGTIEGRRLKGHQLEKAYFTKWIDFYRRRAMAGEWESVLGFQSRKPANIIARHAGIKLHQDTSWDSFTDQYFEEMVAQPAKSQPSFDEKIRNFLRSAELPLNENVQLKGKWDPRGDLQDIPFAFALTNTRDPQVLSGVPLRQSSVYAFKAGVDAVHRVNPNASFVALTSYETDKDSELLVPLEAGAHSLNIDGAEALEELHAVLGI